MEKVLIYATAAQGSQELAAYEEAVNQIEKGNEVLFLYCDKVIGGCLNENPGFVPVRCKICVSLQKKRARNYLPKSVKYEPLSSYWNTDVEKAVNDYIPQYKTADEYRMLKYKGVSVGYGAMSSYISLTRNMEPEMKPNVINYLNKLLKMQVILTELFNRAVDDFNPDLVIFHNGRLAQYKPMLNICQNRKLHFLVTESQLNNKGVFMKNYYENCTPHDVAPNNAKYEEFWENYQPIEERDAISRSYYENKRVGGNTNEIVFTKSQVLGKMPETWNPEKRHIIIYNSSEDEYCAINEEVDKAALFKSQIEGISKIVEHFAGNDEVQVYLRIHPNLRNIKYAYHTDNYKIKADNFYIIPPDSPISSYSLLDQADLVIVFGSTIGIEATYFGKPTICLAYALYSMMGVNYIPKTQEEFWKLVDDKDLKPLSKENCLKYSLFIMSDKHEYFKNEGACIKDHHFLGRNIRTTPYLKLFGSDVMFQIMHEMFMRRFSINDIV